MEPADNHNPSHSHGGLNDGPLVATGDTAQSSAPLVPPYWSHRRYESYCSVGAAKPAPITLEDHTGEQSCESNAAWAKGVAIDDHVLVTGSVPNVGNFIVWNCRIDTLDVSTIVAAVKQYLSYSMDEGTDTSSGRVHNNQKEVSFCRVLSIILLLLIQGTQIL